MTYTCPECSQNLVAQKQAWACLPCQTIYPQVDGIPWLVPSPSEQLAAWRLKLQALLAHLDSEATCFKEDLKRPGLGTLTQKRLRKMLQAKVEHKKALIDLLAPLYRACELPSEILQATGIEIPSGQTLTGYYTNVHRDWAWDTQENAACLDVLKNLLGTNANLGHALVLGAGACRLPYDIYQTYKPKTLVASDINPFMLLTAKRILRGKPLKLYEFPIAPRDLESHAILRKCAAPAPVDEKFQLVFADALRPPFPKQSFDSIITPWLIDILPWDLKILSQSINHLLKPGGVWINFGSLAFQHANQAINYSFEETLEVVQGQGFILADTQKATIPYMQSPNSHHGRLETVLSFAATKQSESQREEVISYLPEWLKKSNLQVPLTPAFQTARLVHTIYTDVLSLINGQSSIQDMAQTFGTRHGMNLSEATSSIHTFLKKIWEESQTRKNF
jgi:hypothetical protein